MAFKFIVLCAVLAVAQCGSISYTSPITHYAVANPSVDAIGSTQQNVVRSFGGTVSQYSKAVDTPYSSVRKTDTRINNNVYTPAYAKTLTYAAPAPVVKYAEPQAVYAQPASAIYAHPTPAVYAQQAPAVYAQQAQAVYAHSAPVAYAQPSNAYVSHVADPTVSAYSSKAISYSPAAAVAHVTFDGFGAHYGY